MYEDILKELEQSRENLQDIAGELGFDILTILGSKRVSLNDDFPQILKEKLSHISKEDLYRLFKAFFIFQSLTLNCLDSVIMRSFDENIKKAENKKRELQNEIWKNYFHKLMGSKEDIDS